MCHSFVKFIFALKGSSIKAVDTPNEAQNWICVSLVINLEETGISERKLPAELFDAVVHFWIWNRTLSVLCRKPPFFEIRGLDSLESNLTFASDFSSG